MTKIYYDDVNLKKLVSPKLDTSMNLLKTIVKVSNDFYVPSNFKYANYLKSLSMNISKDLVQLNKVYSIIKDTSSTIYKLNKDIDSGISHIENYSISLRQSAIK